MRLKNQHKLCSWRLPYMFRYSRCRGAPLDVSCGLVLPFTTCSVAFYMGFFIEHGTN